MVLRRGPREPSNLWTCHLIEEVRLGLMAPYGAQGAIHGHRRSPDSLAQPDFLCSRPVVRSGGPVRWSGKRAEGRPYPWLIPTVRWRAAMIATAGTETRWRARGNALPRNPVARTPCAAPAGGRQRVRPPRWKGRIRRRTPNRGRESGKKPAPAGRSCGTGPREPYPRQRRSSGPPGAWRRPHTGPASSAPACGRPAGLRAEVHPNSGSCVRPASCLLRTRSVLGRGSLNRRRDTSREPTVLLCFLPELARLLPLFLLVTVIGLGQVRLRFAWSWGRVSRGATP